MSIDVFHVRSIPQLYTNDIYRRVDADYPRPTPRKYKQRVKWRLKLYKIIIMIIIIKQKKAYNIKTSKINKIEYFLYCDFSCNSDLLMVFDDWDFNNLVLFSPEKHSFNLILLISLKVVTSSIFYTYIYLFSCKDDFESFLCWNIELYAFSEKIWIYLISHTAVWCPDEIYE